jgi:hypothetical protein
MHFEGLRKQLCGRRGGGIYGRRALPFGKVWPLDQRKHDSECGALSALSQGAPESQLAAVLGNNSLRQPEAKTSSLRLAG